MQDLLLPGTGHSKQVPIHHLQVVKVLDWPKMPKAQTRQSKTYISPLQTTEASEYGQSKETLKVLADVNPF